MDHKPWSDPEINKRAKAASEASSGEAPGYVEICPQCKGKIPGNMVQQGGLHMYCFGIEIDVWFISLPDCPEHGYYENDVRRVANMLESAEDAYLVERKQMKAGQFYNLPEFEGF